MKQERYWGYCGRNGDDLLLGFAFPETSRIPAPVAETPRLTAPEIYSRSVGCVNSREIHGKRYSKLE